MEMVKSRDSRFYMRKSRCALCRNGSLLPDLGVATLQLLAETTLVLVLLIPGLQFTRVLVVLIHLLRPDALDSTAYALTRSLLADDNRHKCHRGLASVAILRLHAVGVGCGDREGREEGWHASL